MKTKVTNQSSFILRAKKLDEPIFVNDKMANNVLEISAIINGRRVAVKFIGYTVMQAVKKFKETYNIK